MESTEANPKLGLGTAPLIGRLAEDLHKELTAAIQKRVLVKQTSTGRCVALPTLPPSAAAAAAAAAAAEEATVAAEETTVAAVEGRREKEERAEEEEEEEEEEATYAAIDETRRFGGPARAFEEDEERVYDTVNVECNVYANYRPPPPVPGQVHR